MKDIDLVRNLLHLYSVSVLVRGLGFVRSLNPVRSCNYNTKHKLTPLPKNAYINLHVIDTKPLIVLVSHVTYPTRHKIFNSILPNVSSLAIVILKKGTNVLAPQVKSISQDMWCSMKRNFFSK